MELRGVREGELRGLCGHGAADFGDAVADADYRGLAGSVEETAAILIDDPATFATGGDGIRLAKVSREEGGVGRHGDRRIVAEAETSHVFVNEASWGAAVLRPYGERKRGRLARVYRLERGDGRRLAPLGRAKARPHNVSTATQLFR